MTGRAARDRWSWVAVVAHVLLWVAVVPWIPLGLMLLWLIWGLAGWFQPPFGDHAVVLGITVAVVVLSLSSFGIRWARWVVATIAIVVGSLGVAGVVSGQALSMAPFANAPMQGATAAIGVAGGALLLISCILRATRSDERVA